MTHCNHGAQLCTHKMSRAHPLQEKSILIVMPASYGIHEAFSENLKVLGIRFVLHAYDSSLGKFYSTPTLWRRVRIWFGCLFRQSRSMRINRSLKAAREFKQKFSTLGKFDYALIIRPEFLSHENVTTIKAISENFYGYCWDGMTRCHEALEYRKYLKKLYVFDPVDARPEEGMPLISNFYFDCYPAYLPEVTVKKADVYFIGTYDVRVPLIAEICEKLRGLGLTLDIQFNIGSKPLLPSTHPDYFQFCAKAKPYKEALAELTQALIVLDVHRADVHSGLSFRVFEALGHHKKLITTCPLVKSYAFSHPNNIYCYGYESRSLADFLAAPLVSIDEETRRHYGLEQWLGRVFELT